MGANCVLGISKAYLGSVCWSYRQNSFRGKLKSTSLGGCVGRPCAVLQGHCVWALLEHALPACFGVAIRERRSLAKGVMVLFVVAG